MKFRLALLWLTALAATAATLATPMVSNVHIHQPEGTRLVAIRYDLTGDSGRTYTVGIEFSADGGQTFSAVTGLTGAVGAGIAPGSGKQAQWDAREDWAAAYFPAVRARVTATEEVAAIVLAGDLAFGQVDVGQTATRLLTIHNTGNRSLVVTSISYPPGFSGNWNSGTIPRNGNQQVVVTFSPTSPQSYAGNLTVNSDATYGANTHPLSGMGSSSSMDGLVGLFPFDGIIEDLGSPSTAVTQSGIRYVADRFGGSESAILLEGHNDSFVRLESQVLNSLDDQFTISLWIKPDSTGAILAKRTIPATDLGIHFLLMLKPSGLSFQFSGEGAPSPYYTVYEELGSFASLTNGEWHHVIVEHTYRAPNKTRVYVNLEVQQGIWKLSPSGYPAAGMQSPLVLGRQFVQTSLPFRGSLDHLVIFRRELSFEERVVLFIGNPYFD